MAVNYERIGKRIQELRKLKKMSQADLAEHTGMSVSYISHIETGIKHASLESVVRIANALGITVTRFSTEARLATAKSTRQNSSSLSPTAPGMNEASFTTLLLL